MNRNQPPAIARTPHIGAILIVAFSFWTLPRSEAQKRSIPAEFDYYSLSLSSISNTAREAAKLPNIPERVGLLLNAARLLAPSQHDEAIKLLDVALGDLKKWASEEKASWHQRYTAATLSNEVLALYAALDSEKAILLQQEFQATEKSTSGGADATSLKNEGSFTDFTRRRLAADRAAGIALSLVDTDPDKALALVLQSLQDGVVSGVLSEIVEKLLQKGDRQFLTKVELSIGKVLATSVTFDSMSMAYSSVLFHADKNMPAATRNAFVSFFMRSLQDCAKYATSGSENGSVDTSFAPGVFLMASLNVRPIILEQAPEQLLMFEQLLNRVAPLVPAELRLRQQAFQPETFSNPRDRLNDILKDPAPAKRDLRLVRLFADLMRKDSRDFEKNLDLAADVTSSFSDADGKSAFTDLLTITRIDLLVRQKKFIEAQDLAGLISSEETRVWALLALSAVAAQMDPVLGFELLSNALKGLDKVSPSPHKVELALTAAAMLASSDSERAFDVLSTASKYANSSPSRVPPATKPAVAFGLGATIGEAHTTLGIFPESLGELEIDKALSTLATTDWFRVDSIVDNVREPSLRLRLRLQFAGAVLARESKRKQKEAAAKSSKTKLTKDPN